MVEKGLKDGLQKALRDGLPSHLKSIKVDVKTWNALKNLKQENETFNDVIKTFLDERTRELGSEQMKAIKYKRKTVFLKTSYNRIEVGLEFEYNDVKSQQTDFTLDLAIRKVFHGKKSVNPSIFFGLPPHLKYFSKPYLNLYLQCVAYALRKEFRVNTQMTRYEHYEDIILWKNIYHEYALSLDSFTRDIEDPLTSSEEEKPTKKEAQSIKESVSFSVWS